MLQIITAELFHEDTEIYRPISHFETFDGFYAYASRFRQTSPKAVLRAVISNGFVITPGQIRMLDDLGIERA